MDKTDLAPLIQAFDRLAAGGFHMGADWQAVHEICQANEGEKPFDWGHALCHRIEGDDWNADYWYRRAGKRRAAGTVAKEWSAMRAELSAQL
ncbi:hypothetical protein C9413_05260 [Rhizobium sp. SEMIA 4085]|uniref:Uncharacterized protein n=1 Tax=Rhizobium gallicum bv. gallicum R602sp TaxID=1041138 RepID=A0A0B4X100_9HYPH|nr:MULTISPECIES: hypothetical protein [Rhizobium]AJD40871.1 hypothetical protein RGR602_CH01519 [Rhizobium gallicum bv. gallicum R602sp]NNH28932.1 hypothetical protein [Rhizobium sp. SEMIA 4085]TDW24815.1 hypothetical protein EV128_121101 [Rhizobium azibense]